MAVLDSVDRFKRFGDEQRETWDSKILINSGEDEYAGWRFQIGATDVSLFGVASSGIGKATARNETSAAPFWDFHPVVLCYTIRRLLLNPRHVFIQSGVRNIFLRSPIGSNSLNSASFW